MSTTLTTNDRRSVRRRPDVTAPGVRARRLRRFAGASRRDRPAHRLEIAEVGAEPAPGEIALSSHRTSEGIVTYFRRADGSTVVRRRPTA